jgi:glycerophosphoryl diester phosphodiesterase
MARLEWLTARPIAHRGLHVASNGVTENTGAAFSAAIESGYGIETDLQISADGEAMVHHDDALGRLTDASGRLAEMSAAEIKAVRFKAGAGRILALGELCDLVAGRVALLLELKSHFDSDTRLAERAIDVLGPYRGPVALMSFDPALVEFLRHKASGLPRGIVAERYYSHPEWDALSSTQKRSMSLLLHVPRSCPQFLAYSVKDLPAMPPIIAGMSGLPLLTWTVRNADDRNVAARWADQIIFEGWRP